MSNQKVEDRPKFFVAFTQYLNFSYFMAHFTFTALRYLSTSLILKFIYSEKATKFCEIFPLLLTVCPEVKSKGKMTQNFVAF